MNIGSVFVVWDNFHIFFRLFIFSAVLFVITSGQGPVTQVNAILNSNVFLPCDMRAPITTDSATLVLWYKETEENPVYSFDNRGRLPESGSHWKDNVIFGGRAFFRSKSSPSGLSLDGIQASDEGYYRCRVDFDRSPTKNQRLYLKIINGGTFIRCRFRYLKGKVDYVRMYEELCTELICTSRLSHPYTFMLSSSKLEFRAPWTLTRVVGTLCNFSSTIQYTYEGGRGDATSPLCPSAAYCGEIISDCTKIPPNEPSIYDENGNNLTEGVTRAYEEGATMTLTCISQGGRPKAQVQWWREGALLDSRIVNSMTYDDADASSASITVTNMNRSHYRTTYSCQAVNNNVTAPASKMVTVNMFLATISVTIINDTQQLTAGNTYKIHCVAIGSVPPAKIMWWKDDQPITYLSEISDSIHESTNKNISTSILTFKPTKNDNNSTIKCIATNPNVKTWRRETSWTLDVTYAPDVLLMLGQELNPNDIKEYSDVYFYCRIQSNPPVYKIIWKHNGVSIHQNLKNEIRVNDKSLILRRVKKESIGNYTCEAFNVEGEKESNAVELRIAYKPVCKPNQKLTYGAARNENIRVICEVDSNPEPETFKWSFNHSQEPIPEKHFTTADRRRGMSILTFTPRTEMDFGYLTCSAKNRVGTQLMPCHYQIIPAVAPHSPQNCTIGNVTTVSLEVHCRPGFDGGLAQTFLLEVINFTTGSLVLNLSSQEPYFKLNRLSPGNSVQVKVYALNAKGHSQPFELEGATLKAEKQTGLPGTLEITPFLGIIVCVFGFVLLFVFVIVCLTKRNSSSLGKSTRRPTSLCIKEKTHTSLLENHDRDEKDPDLIPFKKNTGYQVLRTDANFDDNISKSATLPASNSSQHITVNDHDLISDEEQLNFIDCSEKMSTLSSAKESIVFNKGENT